MCAATGLCLKLVLLSCIMYLYDYEKIKETILLQYVLVF